MYICSHTATHTPTPLIEDQYLAIPPLYADEALGERVVEWPDSRGLPHFAIAVAFAVFKADIFNWNGSDWHEIKGGGVVGGKLRISRFAHEHALDVKLGWELALQMNRSEHQMRPYKLRCAAAIVSALSPDIVDANKQMIFTHLTVDQVCKWCQRGDDNDLSHNIMCCQCWQCCLCLGQPAQSDTDTPQLY